jgi:hypothetical protein
VLDHTQEVKSSSQTDSAAISSRCLLLRMPSDLAAGSGKRNSRLAWMHACELTYLAKWGSDCIPETSELYRITAVRYGRGGGLAAGDTGRYN